MVITLQKPAKTLTDEWEKNLGFKEHICFIIENLKLLLICMPRRLRDAHFSLLGVKSDNTGDRTLLLEHKCDKYLNTSKEKHIHHSKAQVHLNICHPVKVSEATRLM